MELQSTIVSFPELELKTRDGHKLRGFFGNLFKEHSELLHNHYADGSDRYKYPLVQFKVIGKCPYLVGLAEGADLLTDLFLKINYIVIEDKKFDINSKNIKNKVIKINNFTELKEYKFKTLWLALNQNNYKKYIEINDDNAKKVFLNRLLQNNILSFYKGIDFFVEDKIMVKGNFYEKMTKFKNQEMLAFDGNFVTNADLPDFVGIGKSPSRGFGTLERV